MDEITALHTAARRYCMERNPLTWIDDRALGALLFGKTNTPLLHKPVSSALPRHLHAYAQTYVMGAILLAVERVMPAEFDSAAQMHDFLLDAGRSVEIDALREAPVEMQPAIAEQREEFCSYVAGLSADDLQAVAPLPCRRALGIEEIREVWTRLHRRWGPSPDLLWYPLSNGEWYPLDRDGPPDDVLALQAPWFYRAIPPVRLRSILSEHGVERVLLLRQGRMLDQYEMDLSLLSAPLGRGHEVYCTSAAMDWLLYASHESSLAMAGAWLIAEIKQAWLEWERHIYTGYKFPHPPQIDDLHSPASRLIDALLSGEPERVESARAAAINDPEGTGAPLLAVLRNQTASQTDRFQAAKALAQLGAPVVPVMRAALSDEDEEVRRLAVATLGRIGNRRVIASLLRLTRKDTSSDVRAQAVRSLGEIGDPSAVEPLLALLKDEAAGISPLSIISALGQLKDERAIAPLIERLTWPDGELIMPTLRGFGQPIIPALIGVLSDRSRDPAVRAHIDQILIQLDARDAVAPAMAILMDRTDAPEIRRSMIRLVSVLSGWQDMTPLTMLILDRSEADEVRAEAIGVLAWHGQERSADLLMGLLSDPTEPETVRAAVVKQIPRLAPEHDVDLLIDLLGDTEPAVWGTAAETLESRGDERALHALLRLWHNLGEPPLHKNIPLKQGSPLSQLRRAILRIQSHIGFALDPNDDDAGAVIAEYGRVRLREPKQPPSGFIDGIPFYIRFVDGSRERELGLFDAPDSSRATALKVLRRKHADLAHWMATYERQLADDSHAQRAPALQHAIEQQKQQQHWIVAALHELETAPDEG